MDLKKIATRLATNVHRRVVFTKKLKIDSESPGTSRMRSQDEMIEYLEADKTNAILIQSDKDWVAVYIDSNTRKFAVSTVPTSNPANLLSNKLTDATSAVAAALQI
jgi:hypothetical protein